MHEPPDARPSIGGSTYSLFAASAIQELDPLIARAMRTVSPAARRKDILLGLRTGYEGMLVKGEPAPIIRVLVVQLLQAIKHSPIRGVVTVERTATSDRVEVVVFDQCSETDDSNGTSSILTFVRR